MDNIIKSFSFNSEGIELILSIKKEIFKGKLKMFIEGEVKYNNPDIITHRSENGTSKDLSLSFKNSNFFWISSNDWKGLRWEKYSNESRFLVYSNLTEMKEAYIKQREYITLISNYFYESVKKYKELKLLYETNIVDIMDDTK